MPITHGQDGRATTYARDANQVDFAVSSDRAGRPVISSLFVPPVTIVAVVPAEPYRRVGLLRLFARDTPCVQRLGRGHPEQPDRHGQNR
jgi:hypothetical protein